MSINKWMDDLLIYINHDDRHKYFIQVPFSSLWEKMHNHRYRVVRTQGMIKENLITKQETMPDTEEQKLINMVEDVEFTVPNLFKIYHVNKKPTLIYYIEIINL